MKVRWADEAWEDYRRWRRTDLAVWKMINALIHEIQQKPYQGLGRPKALQQDYKGWWSRDIDKDHRLIHRIAEDGDLRILQCRGHYDLIPIMTETPSRQRKR
jgi:toxin YoeB